MKRRMNPITANVKNSARLDSQLTNSPKTALNITMPIAMRLPASATPTAALLSEI